VSQTNNKQVPAPVAVLFVVRKLDYGGIERDVTKLVIGLDRERFVPSVAVYQVGGSRSLEVARAGIPILDLNISSLAAPRILFSALKFCRWLLSNRIRVVHAWDASIVFAAPLARLLRVPLVLASAVGHRDLFDAKTEKQLSLMDSFVDEIVVNCSAMRRHIADDYGVNPSRVQLCYNGVDTNEFYPEQRPKPDVLGEASLVIGTVCVLRPEKRIEMLIEAFASVRSLRPGLKLLIVGSGPELSKLTAQAAALRVEEQCIFLAAVSSVAPYLRAIDIFVSCSSSEAFSNSILEAMACGCCPVGSRVGGTPELIEDGERGLLFESGKVDELAQRLALLIENDDLRKRLAARAAEFAARDLNMQVALDRMGEIYRQGLAKKGRLG
jgi:glycosyltransferase involved in cell wall biosynthesis